MSSFQTLSSKPREVNDGVRRIYFARRAALLARALLRLCSQMLAPLHCLHLLLSIAIDSKRSARGCAGTLPAASPQRLLLYMPCPLHPHAAPSLPCRLPRTKDAFSSLHPPLSPCLETKKACFWFILPLVFELLATFIEAQAQAADTARTRVIM